MGWFNGVTTTEWSALCAVLGACWGSFAHVVYSRTPRMWRAWETRQPMPLWWSFPRSHCPHCHTPLNWMENIPLVAWPLLRGRCQYCLTPIPIRYWLWEISWTVAGAIAGALGGLWTVIFLLATLAITALIEAIWRYRATKAGLIRHAKNTLSKKN